MFSGGGLADIGLMMLPMNVEPLWAIEYNPQIAEVYQKNLGQHIIVSKVENVNFSKLERPTILWASPECQEFSDAKTSGKEGEKQCLQAVAIATALETLLPPVFFCENVRGYINSQSWGIIQYALEQNDYVFNATQVFNAKHFGVPQSRKRLIIRAIHKSIYAYPYQPNLFTGGAGTMPSLRHEESEIGWLKAVEDLLDEAKDTTLAPWQKAALAQWLVKNPIKIPLLVRSANSKQEWGKGYHEADDPAMTVTTDIPPKALLIQKVGANHNLQVKRSHEQCFTVRALGHSRHWEQATGLLVWGGNRTFCATSNIPTPTVTTNILGKSRSLLWEESDTHEIANIEELLSIARIVSAPPRWLARFQTLPDWYELPEKKSLASKIIGNGVPCLMVKKIAQATLEDCLW